MASALELILNDVHDARIRRQENFGSDSSDDSIYDSEDDESYEFRTDSSSSNNSDPNQDLSWLILAVSRLILKPKGLILAVAPFSQNLVY